MSKYPCGICTIGVKHKGILCTAGCNKWYHSKCLNWTDKQFKNLTKTEIESWKCISCQNITQRLETINDTSETSATKNKYTPQTPSLEEINSKLQNYDNMEDIDLETSLTLAAEVGNTLLIENNSLKETIHKLTLTNSNLALKIKSMEEQNLINLEEQIDELLNEKQTLINRNHALVEQLSEAEKQLRKEKQLKNELVINFDEHDKDREDTIKKFKQEIHSLRNEIKHLKQELQRCMNTNHTCDTKKHKNTETQTEPNEETNYRTQPTLPEKIISEIKKKLDSMELAVQPLGGLQEEIKELKKSVHSLKNSNLKTRFAKDLTALKRTETQTNNTEVTTQDHHAPLPQELTRLKIRQDQIDLVIERVQKQLAQLNQNVTNKNTSLTAVKQRSQTPVTDREPLTARHKKGTKYSISLQVAKAATINTVGERYNAKLSNKVFHKLLPPLHSKIKPTDVSYEDFYQNNIDFYKNLITEYYHSPNAKKRTDIVTARQTGILTRLPASPNQLSCLQPEQRNQNPPNTNCFLEFINKKTQIT